MLTENSPNFPTILTERLKLRQLVESDMEEIFALRSSNKINKYLDRQPCTSLDDALQFINKTNENIKNSALKYWAIQLKNSDTLIGTICLFSFSTELKKCEIGFELLPNFQGKGIMKEAANAVIAYAFNTLGLQIIDGFAHKDNLKSTNLLLKLQFVKTEIVEETDPNLVVFRLIH